jgi:probable rRNA maturation factor
MINLTVSIEKQFQNKVKKTFINTLVNQTLNYLDKYNVEITIAIVDSERIRKINKQFREIDEVTDVLSFPSNEIDPDSNIKYLGDIIISFPQVVEQAKEYNNPVELELSLVVIHGILHLLGYDHVTKKDTKEMFSLQNKILSKTKK